MCGIAGCEKAVFNKEHGWCAMHYYRWRRHGSPHTVESNYGVPAMERFWHKVEPADGPSVLGTPCLLWTASTNGGGYATFFPEHGHRTQGHRWLFEQIHGPLPEDVVLDHMCHNLDLTCMGGEGDSHRRCVELSHLVVATEQENINRGRSRQVLDALTAARVVCPNRHVYPPLDQMPVRISELTGRRVRCCPTCLAGKRARARR